jgi:Flp pilus assembly protein TadB
LLAVFGVAAGVADVVAVVGVDGEVDCVVGVVVVGFVVAAVTVMVVVVVVLRENKHLTRNKEAMVDILDGLGKISRNTIDR